MQKRLFDLDIRCHQTGAPTRQFAGIALSLLATTLVLLPVQARTHTKKAPAVAHHAETSRHSSAHHAAPAASKHGRSTTIVTTSHHAGSAHVVTTAHRGGAAHVATRVIRGPHGRKIVVPVEPKSVVATHHGRHRKGVVETHEIVKVVKAAPPKTRYAYPLNFFLLHPPEFDRTILSGDVSNRISRSFHQGYADQYAARSLVRAGLVSYHPLRGGIFWRREPVKYIIMHSTETGIPLSAERVIESWSSMGLRHPGAQYVVERDGTIFQAVDPDLGTVHINIFKTLPGINNDNSIGIEMNHTGRQDYPAAQREAVIKLVAYLQERYKVADENVITHRYAQQGDHTDPVNFDWDGFVAAKNSFRNRAIAYKVRKIKDEVKDWSTTTVTPDSVTTTTIITSPPTTVSVPSPSVTPPPPIREYKFVPAPDASTYLQPHRVIKEAPPVPVYKTTTTTTTVTTAPSVVPDKEPTMILVPPLAEIVPAPAPAAAPPVAPMVLPRNMPALRGPIEMAPGAAPGLNIAPMPGLNTPDYQTK